MKFFILAKFTEPKLLDDGVDEKTKILNTYFNVTGGKIDKVKEIKRLQSELTLEDIQKHLVRERPRAKIIEFTILTKPNTRWVQGEYYAHDYEAFVAGRARLIKWTSDFKTLEVECLDKSKYVMDGVWDYSELGNIHDNGCGDKFYPNKPIK